MTAAEPRRLLEHAMMGRHAELDRRFFLHQQALLDRDPPAAIARLATYREALFAHAEDEEVHVLPRYQALGGDGTEAPLKLFLGEHRNLRAFVAEFGERLATWQGPGDDARLLDLLDRQATFKNLQLHHDLRERNMLYPFLSARLDPETQRTIVACVRFL